jgi:acyl-CoA thioesterase
MKRKMKKEIKQEIDPELDVEFHEHHDEPKIVAETHKEINSHLCGEIEKLEFGYAEIRLLTISDMVADNMDLIHGGFIFAAADYAAMLAVNKRNVILVACDAQFLSPAKLGDIIIIKATLRHKEGSKRNVNVTAFVGDIKIFEAEFKTVITERHVLKLNLQDEADSLVDIITESDL